MNKKKEYPLITIKKVKMSLTLLYVEKKALKLKETRLLGR